MGPTIIAIVVVAACVIVPVAWMLAQRQQAQARSEEAAKQLGGKFSKGEKSGRFEIKADVEGERVKIDVNLNKRTCTAKVKCSSKEFYVRLIPEDSMEGRSMQSMLTSVPDMDVLRKGGVISQPLESKRSVKKLEGEEAFLAAFRELAPEVFEFRAEDVGEGLLEVVLRGSVPSAERLVLLARVSALGARALKGL